MSAKGWIAVISFLWTLGWLVWIVMSAISRAESPHSPGFEWRVPGEVMGNLLQPVPILFVVIGIVAFVIAVAAIMRQRPVAGAMHGKDAAPAE